MCPSPLSKISREIVMSIGIFISINCRSSFNSSANILSITGDVNAPNTETMIAMIKPAIGPAIATSNKISRLIVNPLDWISAPNVGIPKTGTPGIK